MRITFGKFWDLLENNENSKSLNVIRSGNNIRSSECGDFWDDFANLCNNSEGMAELLDIPREKVTGWAGKISELRKEVESEDSNKTNKKHRVIKNGEL